VLAGEDEQGAQQDCRLAGIDADTGEAAPVLEVAEAVLDGSAGSGQGLAGLAPGGSGLAGPGGFVPGCFDASLGLSRKRFGDRAGGASSQPRIRAGAVRRRNQHVLFRELSGKNSGKVLRLVLSDGKQPVTKAGV
jgi:hypothetical protein